MSDAMELEARLKNAITPELEKISQGMTDLSKNTKENTSKISNDFDGLNKITGLLVKSFLGFASAREAIRFFFDCRNAAQEYQKTQLLLKASLGYTSSALEDQTQVLMKKLTIDDEQIRSVQTAISYFTKDEEQIKKLTQASLDFAAATGMDAVSAARLLGRSIEGNTGLLGRYGIKVKESGDELSKVDNIIDSVNKRFGGQAIALAESKDWWDKLKLSIGETKEAIGLLMKSDFWSGKIENKGAEYVAFMEYNYKNAQRILANSDQYSAEVVAKAKARIEEYKNDPEISSERSARFKNDMSKYFDNLKESNLLTAKLQKELWDLTEEGKIKNLEVQRDTELSNVRLTEEQRYLITERYQVQIDNLKQAILDKQIKRDNEIDRMARETYDKAIKLQKEESEFIEQDEQKRIDILNQRFVTEMNRRVKSSEIEKKENEKRKKEDEEITKQKIKNNEFISDASFQTISNLTKASKTSSAMQKTLDIAQATANMALGISKALAPGLQWQIPFIAALGASQIALIASQKYEYGGIVPGNQNTGDKIPAMVNSREMILTLGQQSNLFSLLSRPNQITNNSISNNSQSVSTPINLNITVANGSNYDMNAARYTVDSLVPVLGDALLRARNEGRLRNYETAR